MYAARTRDAVRETARLTTPFGQRPLSAAQIAAQAAAATCPVDACVHKWTVLHDLTAARARMGLSAQSLAVLEALLTFHPDTTLTQGEEAELVVFPSNASLSTRTRGLSDASLRRHLAVLVEAGLVIRRDSPNGKRYVRRGEGGQITQAFGFDLSPLVARGAEIAALAEQSRAAVLALRLARERLTLLRRDCTKLIAALECQEDGRIGSAEVLRCELLAALGRMPRLPTVDQITTAADSIEALAGEATKLLMATLESSESSANASQDERHIQSSKPEALAHEPAIGIGQKTIGTDHATTESSQDDESSTRAVYPLGMVLDACPQIRDYAPAGIRSWQDLIETAGRVRSMLGISPHAWDQARSVMGNDAAAVTVAAILERAEHIRSAGGYLRALVERKRKGQFSLGPVLQARARNRLQALVVSR